MLIPPTNDGASAASPRSPEDTDRPARAGADGTRKAAGEPEYPLRIRVHHVELLPEDVTVLDGIPVTTPARTLLDLATVSDDRELEHALAEALRRGLTDRPEILAVIARYPHHRGGPRLRTLLDARTARLRR